MSIISKALSAGLVSGAGQKLMYEENFQSSLTQGAVTAGSVMLVDYFIEFLPQSLISSLGIYAEDLLSSILATLIHYYANGSYGIKKQKSLVKGFLLEFSAVSASKYIVKPISSIMPSSVSVSDMDQDY